MSPINQNKPRNPLKNQNEPKIPREREREREPFKNHNEPRNP